MKNQIKNKTVLVTGGTGSFGNKFVDLTLKQMNPKRIIIFSRDEMKQYFMSEKFKNQQKLKFVIGDVKDKSSLLRNLDDVDLVVHAAATKIVPTAEYNPFECIKTNIIGAMNVIDACTEKRISKVVALSTDKASNPHNLYGASKLASDKLFIASNTDLKKNKTKLSVVRYGNVMNSRGSVIPFFINKGKEGTIPITDKRMTRFMISLDAGVKLVWHAFNDMQGGEIYVKKIPSMLVTDMAKAVAPKAKHKIIGVRPGEKIHEQMIGTEDARHTYEYEQYFKILPSLYNWDNDKKRIKNGKLVKKDFVYSSDLNKEWMSVGELREWVKANMSDIV